MSQADRDRLLRLAPALVGVVGAVYIVLVALDSRPIADDWWFIGDAQRWGFGRYMNFNLGAASDRASQFALAWVSERLFGWSAVNLTPIVLLALALGFAAGTVRAIGRLMGTEVAWVASAGLAILAVVSVIATTPSMFDTVGWFNAVVIYLAAVVTTMGVACWLVCQAAQGGAAPVPMVVGAAMLAAVAAGFNEIVGMSLALAGALAVITVSDLSRHSGTAGQRRLPLAAISLGATLGTAANVLGPGSQSRADVQHAHVSLVAAARTALHNLSFLRADIHDGVVLLAVATGVVAWQLFGSLEDRRLRRWCGVWALFLVVVPWLVTAALTAWGGSTESGDRSPFRAGFLATGSVALGLILIVFLVLSRFPRMLSQPRATLLALLLVAVGTVGIAHKTDPIIRAERMRARVVSERLTSVKRQLVEGRTTIRLVPAPLLTVFTQAYDLSFVPLAEQRAGWVRAVRDYYDIPAGDRVTIEANQPPGYCLPDVAASWVGVRSCQELTHRPRQS